jgi:hypothetical protein
MLAAALEVPDLHHALPVDTEAYALAPAAAGRGVLIKTTLPIEALSLVPAEDAQEGRVMIRGVARREQEVACAFGQDIVIRRFRESRLIYQTGCVLEPGLYELTVAVLDRGAMQIGARRSPLLVRQTDAGGTVLGEVHLWTRDPEALVVTSGTKGIGIQEQAGGGAFVPRAERRLGRDQGGIFSYFLCPPEDTPIDEQHPLLIEMEVLAGSMVISSDQIRITEPPATKGSLCHSIARSLPSASMPAGIYSLDIRVRGAGSGPVARRADFAVE